MKSGNPFRKTHLSPKSVPVLLKNHLKAAGRSLLLVPIRMNRRWKTFFFGPLVAGVLSVFSCHSPQPLRGLSPEEGLASLQVAEGFQVELIAAEPLVADPIAMEIDELGRLYVVEMHGYPLDKSGSGKIRLLTDTDGDGKMDHSTVFAEDLVLPTGVMRWKKGILVTDPPHVFYLEDTDGDGRADVRKEILTGFALANPQHNVNTPVLGLDNWIYLGHEPAATAKVYTKEFGDKGNEVYFPASPNGPRLPENALGRSVRFQPDRLQLENLSSNTQFGHTFDQWGRRFLVGNANHAIHEVMAAQYLHRNPNLLIPNATASISDHGNAADVYPVTKNPEHQLLTDLGVFTSACGITAYSGGLFPALFDSVTLVAEPVSNLVHADVLKHKGATFTAGRVYGKSEFLASTDAWFRPVNLYIGPDGALYVVDYYRQIIEHPEWMADDAAQSGALYNGIDQGRIYRITPRGSSPINWSGKTLLDENNTGDLVKALSHSNSWWRRNAQRLLTDKQDPASIGPLEHLALQGEAAPGRLHALWTLQGMDKLRAGVLENALADKTAGVRENAVRIAELALQNERFADKSSIITALIGLQQETHPKVAYQLLCTLGFLETAEAIHARKQLLFRHLDDEWMQLAALSAQPSPGDRLLEEVLARYQKDVPAYASLVERLSRMTGNSGDTVQIRSLVQQALQSRHKGWEAAVLKGLARGYKAGRPAGLQKEKELLVQTALSHPEGSLRTAGMELLYALGLPDTPLTGIAMERAMTTLRNRNAPSEERAEAARFVAIDRPEQHAEVWKELIDTAEPLQVQLAALSILNGLPDSTVSRFLVEKWPRLTHGVREAAIGNLLRNDTRISFLLEALEKDIIDPSAISWPRQVGLMANGDEQLRSRARKLLSEGTGIQEGVIKDYREALSLTGDVRNGSVVFEKNCSVCHQIGGGNGTLYGPDLGTIRNRRPESILADILNPNLSIADGYDIWNIELKSGETVQGLIASETPAALTLRNYGGAETTIARNDIVQLHAMGVSVMPAGLEGQITKQEMADLLTYIRHAD